MDKKKKRNIIVVVIVMVVALLLYLTKDTVTRIYQSAFEFTQYILDDWMWALI